MTVTVDAAIAALRTAFRDYTTENLPSSAEWAPDKPEIRAALATLGAALNVAISAAGGGLQRYETVALMTAETGEIDGQLAYVWLNNGAEDDPANGIYQSDAGVWTEASWYFAAVAGVVQPLVDDAEGFRDAATAAAALAQAWAEGTLPGGAGTKSAKEYADIAAGYAEKPIWTGKLNGWPDTFFRRFDLTSQTFLGKDRWYQATGVIGDGWSRVKGSLFDGYVLRRGAGYNTTSKSGPSIWLDEINVAEGESVTAYLLIADPAAAGGTVYSQYFFSTDSDFTSVGGLALMTNLAGTTAGIVANATPKWLRITATRPVGATRLNLTPYNTAGATGFDVLACWAFKGAAADGPAWPVIEGSYTSLRDAEIATYMAANSITQSLKDWMRSEAYTITSTLTYNALGRVVSPVNIVWPDGGTGVLTLVYNVDGTVASLSATYVNGAVTKTVAQPTITYAQGLPSVIPAITVV